jgi:hypothetical protein
VTASTIRALVTAHATRPVTVAQLAPSLLRLDVHEVDVEAVSAALTAKGLDPKPRAARGARVAIDVDPEEGNGRSSSRTKTIDPGVPTRPTDLPARDLRRPTPSTSSTEKKP